MTGFEGIGDFDSDDPWQRYIAHQAAKGNYPIPPGKPVPPVREVRYCPNCGRVMSEREYQEQGQCNDCEDGLFPPMR